MWVYGLFPTCLSQQYNKMMSKMNLKKDKISGIQKALKSADKDNDKKIDINEFRAELKL